MFFYKFIEQLLYRTIYKYHSFNMYEDVTQVLDGEFIKRIIDKLDGVE